MNGVLPAKIIAAQKPTRGFRYSRPSRYTAKIADRLNRALPKRYPNGENPAIKKEILQHFTDTVNRLLVDIPDTDQNTQTDERAFGNLDAKERNRRVQLALKALGKSPLDGSLAGQEIAVNKTFSKATSLADLPKDIQARAVKLMFSQEISLADLPIAIEALSSALLFRMLSDANSPSITSCFSVGKLRCTMAASYDKPTPSIDPRGYGDSISIEFGILDPQDKHTGSSSFEFLTEPQEKLRKIADRIIEKTIDTIIMRGFEKSEGKGQSCEWSSAGNGRWVYDPVSRGSYFYIGIVSSTSSWIGPISVSNHPNAHCFRFDAKDRKGILDNVRDSKVTGISLPLDIGNFELRTHDEWKDLLLQSFPN
jgi:hypothetical protein